MQNSTPLSSQLDPLICLTAAARLLGISDPTLRRLVRVGRLAVIPDPIDGRRKLVRREEVERLRAVHLGLSAGKEEADVP